MCVRDCFRVGAVGGGGSCQMKCCGGTGELGVIRGPACTLPCFLSHVCSTSSRKFTTAQSALAGVGEVTYAHGERYNNR